jgi:hypothetical protein
MGIVELEHQRRVLDGDLGAARVAAATRRERRQVAAVAHPIARQAASPRSVDRL